MTLPEIQKLWPDVKFGCVDAGDIYLIWGDVTRKTCIYAPRYRRKRYSDGFWQKKGAAYNALDRELQRLRFALTKAVM